MNRQPRHLGLYGRRECHDRLAGPDAMELGQLSSMDTWSHAKQDSAPSCYYTGAQYKGSPHDVGLRGFP